MPFTNLSEFLSNMILYYVHNKKPARAWNLLEFHLSYKENISEGAKAKEVTELAKCSLKALAKLQQDSEFKIEDLQLPKSLVLVFEMAKLELFCDQGKGKEAFEVLFNSHFGMSSESNDARNLFFSFIRFCEMEVHGTLLSPYEKAQKWGYTKILSAEECVLMKKRLNCNWLLFHIQNNSLDMVVKCYGYLTSSIDLAKDSLAELTYSYILFLQKNAKHSEVFEVLDKLKKRKLADAKVFLAMSSSLKLFHVKTYARQFFEALTELKVEVISSNMCHSLIGITLLPEHDASLMVKATIYCAEFNYQPSSKQLEYIIKQLIKNDKEVDYNLLMSFINCLSYDSLICISKLLEQFFRTVPPCPDADAIVRICKSKGIDLIPFVSVTNMITMNYDASPVQNQDWVDCNTIEQNNFQKRIFIEPYSHAPTSTLMTHQNKDSNLFVAHPVGIMTKQTFTEHSLLNKVSVQTRSYDFNHNMNQNKMDSDGFEINFPNDRVENQNVSRNVTSRYEGDVETIEEIIEYTDDYGLATHPSSSCNLSFMQSNLCSSLMSERRYRSDMVSGDRSSICVINNYILPVLSPLKKNHIYFNDWNVIKKILKKIFGTFTEDKVFPIHKLGDVFDALLHCLFDGTESKNDQQSSIQMGKLMGHLGSSLLFFCFKTRPDLRKLAENVVLTLHKRKLPFYNCLPIQVVLPPRTQLIAVMALQILVLGNHMDEIVSIIEGMVNMQLFDSAKEVPLTKIKVFNLVINKLLSTENDSSKELKNFLRVILCVLKTYIHDRNVLGFETYETLININSLLLNAWNWNCPDSCKDEHNTLYESIKKLCVDNNIPLPLNVASEVRRKPSENNFSKRAIIRKYPGNIVQRRPVISWEEFSPHQNIYHRSFNSSRRPRGRRGGTFAPY